MTGAAITIRRQVLGVDLRATEADGLALQRQLPAICADVIAPVLESALEQFDPGDDHLVIERLLIDLPDVPLDRLTGSLAGTLRRAAEEAMLGLRTAGAAMAGDVGDDRIERRTAANTADDALLAFLASGRLPWSFRLPAGATLERVVTNSWADAGPPTATRARLLSVLGASEARVRLRLQFSSAFVLAVLRAVAPPVATGVTEVLELLRETADPGPPPSSAQPTATVDRLVGAALAEDPAGYRPTTWELVRRAILSGGSSAAPVSGPDPLVALLERRRPGVPGDSPDASASGNPRPGESPSSAGSAPGTSRTTPLARARQANPGHPGIEAASEGIMVADAGLVLLAPFLPRLFDGLGLAADGELLDPGRATCLLHHLATGELAAPEHEVTLAKVLCGLRLSEPVPLDVGLTRAETDEATVLLTAVIGHWTALRDTSPDVLRVEFLRRPGILSTADRDEWLLRVEAQAADILLSQLPWGISMIRLPWMPHMLQVEWAVAG